MVTQEDITTGGRCPGILADLLNNGYEVLRDRHIQANIIYDGSMNNRLSVNPWVVRYMNHLIIRIRPDVLEYTNEMLAGGFAHELSHVVLFLEGKLEHTEEDANQDVRARGYGEQLGMFREGLQNQPIQ